jgi:hypothetical protein
MHPKYQDYHIESKEEGMLTCTYELIKNEDNGEWRKAIKEEKD